MVSVLGRFLFVGRGSPVELWLVGAVLPAWLCAGGVPLMDISRSVPDD